MWPNRSYTTLGPLRRSPSLLRRGALMGSWPMSQWVQVTLPVGNRPYTLRVVWWVFRRRNSRRSGFKMLLTCSRSSPEFAKPQALNPQLPKARTPNSSTSCALRPESERGTSSDPSCRLEICNGRLNPNPEVYARSRSTRSPKTKVPTRLARSPLLPEQDVGPMPGLPPLPPLPGPSAISTV